MKAMQAGIIVLLLFTAGYGQPQTVEKSAPQTAKKSLPQKEKGSVPQKVLSRFIGSNRASEIKFKTIPDDSKHPGQMVFEVEAKDGKVVVSGNSVVAQLRGVYTYLKEACNSMITWSGQHIEIPNVWPDYSKRVVGPCKYTLQDNVVTFGYTTPYFKWLEWRRYLDVMALHGYNMMFTPVGEEAIWRRVWKKMGFSDQELANFFTGPAFLAWHRMGNINKHSGPIPDSFFPQSVRLEKKILKRMRALDITPIAPAFAGFVPKQFKAKFTKAKVRNSHTWGGFNASYRTHILNPLSPYFHKIGHTFIKAWEKEFGKARFFFADSFNEMTPPVSSDHSEKAKQKDLARYGNAIYATINSAEPGATWVKQGWLFLSKFWTKARAKAFLSQIPDDKMMIIDLYAESRPQWSRLNNFFGKLWMYSIIPNWGGNSQIGGLLTRYGRLISKIKQRHNTGNLVGFGYSPEGTENNEAIYELASDAAWSHQAIHLDRWLAEYCKSRYGKANQALIRAWKLLSKGVYNREVKHEVNLFQTRPDGGSFSGITYASRDPHLDKALGLFLSQAEQFKDNALFMNDLIEIATYHFSALADHHVKTLKKWVRQKKFKRASAEMRQVKKLLSNIDLILSGHTIDNMSRWVSLAKAWGKNKKQRDYYAADAKRLITYWGGDLSEYGAKLWSGLVKNYYLARWQAWYKAKRNGKDFNINAWDKKWVQTTADYHSKKVNNANNVISLIKRLRKEYNGV